MLRFLWRRYRTRFLRLYAQEQFPARGFEEMEKAMVDSDGRQYYRFGRNLAMSIDRLGKLQEYITWMSAGLTEKELHALLDRADKALTEGLTHKNNAARIGAILTEIRDRKNLVLHTELLYNYLAVQYVREDEDPARFSNHVHLQKVEQFKKEMDAGNSGFFFQVPELRQLLNSINMSEQEFKAHWHDSIVKQEALRQAIEKIL